MLRVERDGQIGIWTLSRPHTKNALNWEMIDALSHALVEATKDPALRALVLTGEGDAFASGGDLRELRDQTTEADARKFADAGERICERMGELEIPVIAAIPGVAYGGGAELALACDLRIANAAAKISFKQVRLGVTTAWGTIPRLVSVVGHAAASRLLYTAHEVSATEARAMGLVDQVAEDGTCVAVALAWASDIAQGSRRAVADMKALLRALRAPSQEVRALEREKFVATWTGADHAEAVAAYFSRRPPVWKD